MFEEKFWKAFFLVKYLVYAANADFSYLPHEFLKRSYTRFFQLGLTYFSVGINIYLLRRYVGSLSLIFVSSVSQVVTNG
jgi:hypothetical protein